MTPDLQGGSLSHPDVALTAEVRAQMLSLFSTWGATDVAVFGSVARGAAKPGSDIDLVAKSPSGFSLFDMVDLAGALEDLLGVRVDLVSDDSRAGTAIEDIRRTCVPLTKSSQ